MDNFRKGILTTIFLSLVAITFFFSDILKSPNEYYFSEHGDGFKSYYGAIYHLQYDSSYFHFEGMNYPYGESVFFTDNQPLITNTVKWISNNVVDVRDYIVGIINLSMVFSILFGAIFLFLTFFRLGINWWFGAFASIGITLLSPQIARMGGHFSLSHVFWIPLMLYLLLKYDKHSGWKLSSLIAFVVFLASSMHLYFAGFYGLLIGFYWLFKVVQKNVSKEILIKALLHGFVQIILPVLLVQIVMVSTDFVTDRTTHPYGFLVYLAHPVSVFLPAGAPYGFVPKVITVFRHLDWEAYCFIGVVALTGSIVALGRFIQGFFKGKLKLRITEVPILNIFFWASFAGLLLSFGIPFKPGGEFLIDYIGPFRQLRALARFAWLFYYVINLIVFYQLYDWSQRESNRNKTRAVVLFVALGTLFFDAYFNVNNMIHSIQNRKPVLEDKQNMLVENHWVDAIDVSKYQAILPIPYFHVGSENIWIDPKKDVLETTLIASLKTGLPTTAVMMGRTSINQTYKNYSLVLEPLHRFEVLDDFDENKLLLILRMKEHVLNEEEARLIKVANFEADNEYLECYSLPIEQLKKVPTDYRQEIIASFQPDSLVFENGIFRTDTTSFLYISNKSNVFEKVTDDSGLKPIVWNTLFEGGMKRSREGDRYLVSFWLADFREDGVPRFNIEIIQQNRNGENLDYFYLDIHRYLKAIDGNRALFEVPFMAKADHANVKISIRNRVLKDYHFKLSQLLIRREGTSIFQTDSDDLIVNTREIVK